MGIKKKKKKNKKKKKTYEASNLPSGVRPDGSKPNDLLGNVWFRISPAGVNTELSNPWGWKLHIKTGGRTPPIYR